MKKAPSSLFTSGIRFSLIPLLAFNLSACSFALQEAGLYKSSKNENNSLGSSVGAFADQKISFEVLKATSLRTCLECHTGGKNAIATADQLLALKTTVLSEVATNEMPPKSSGYKSLTDCEKQILETWIDDQSKNTESVKIKELSKCGDARPPIKEEKPDLKTLPVTFENLQKYIIAPKCLSCHSADKAEDDVVLDTWAAMTSGDHIGATAEESDLYKMTLPTARKLMPPRKSGIPALNDDERNFLKTWIDNGAKE
jgi:uncharacterized membrane protein